MFSLKKNAYKCLPVFPLKVVSINKKTPVFGLDFTHRNFLSIENACKGINQSGDGTISNNINGIWNKNRILVIPDRKGPQNVLSVVEVIYASQAPT